MLLAPFIGPVKWLKGHKSNPEAGRGGYDVPWKAEELMKAFCSAGLKIERFERIGIMPHVHYFKFFPKMLVGSIVGLFTLVDRYLMFLLEPIAWHLRVVVSRPDDKTSR